jgi:hypothetical protein
MRAEYILSTPTLTLPHQGGGNYLGNFKYLWPGGGEALASLNQGD